MSAEKSEGVVDELLKSAEQYRYQDPEKCSFRDC